jgi:hypothetical protein
VILCILVVTYLTGSSSSNITRTKGHTHSAVLNACMDSVILWVMCGQVLAIKM